MPRPRTKIPDDALIELEHRRSALGQSLGQLVRYLKRDFDCEITESALSWQLLRLGIDLPVQRRQADRIDPARTYRRGNVVIRKFQPDEDAIIRRLGAQGMRPTAIARHLPGRKSHSVLGRMMTLARHDARQQGD